MCGIVGAVAQRNVSAILIEGLHRLEYRGYDSAGLSIISGDQQLQTLKSAGKVAELESAVKAQQLSGQTGMLIPDGPPTANLIRKTLIPIILAPSQWCTMALLKTTIISERS